VCAEILELKIPGRLNLILHTHRKQFITASTSMLVYLTSVYIALAWRWALQTHYMLLRNTVSKMKGFEEKFLKNYCGLFAYTLPNCHINYVINVNKTFIKISNFHKQTKLNLQKS